jgi:CPA1 family monovalent cation:H+ antiporter
MRGALSLAAALSIPATVEHREEILFLTFTTILATLVVLAIPLPWLLEWLGFTGSTEERDMHARRRLAEAALTRLSELEGPPSVVNGLRSLYEARLARLDARLDPQTDHPDGHLELRRELLTAERQALWQLEESGDVDFSSARDIERQLDLEEAGLRG